MRYFRRGTVSGEALNENKLRMAVVVAAMLVAPLLAQGPPTRGYHGADLSRSIPYHPLVVMVRGKNTFGAGIVISVERDAVYVVTANHVVRGADGDNHPFGVQFPSTKTEVSAVLEDGHDGEIAVLRVGELAKQGLSACSFPMDVLASSAALERGHPVFPVGYTAGVRWFAPTRPDTVDSSPGAVINFQTAVVFPGSSGGPLLDAFDGHLLGMVTEAEPPLGRAIKIESVAERLRILNYPFGLFAVSASGAGPLHDAIASKKMDGLLREVGGPCPKLEQKDYHGLTPLAVASAMGWIEGVEVLLKAGADVDGKQSSVTPLIEATSSRHASVLAALLENHADPNLGSPLTEAVEVGDTASLRRLLEKGARVDLATAPKGDGGGMMMGQVTALLYFTITHGDIGTLKLLLDHGADPNGFIAGHGNLLTIAGWSSTPEIVELLLSKKAELDKVGGLANGTALHGAIVRGNLQMAKALVGAGSNLQAMSLPGPAGDTPLGLAYLHLGDKDGSAERQAIFEFLLANERTAPEDLTHLLALVLDHGDSENARRILKRGVSSKVWQGDQPINGALSIGDAALVEQLIGVGIDVNARDRRGLTPLTVLVLSQKFSASEGCRLLKLLEERGGTVSIVTGQVGNAIRSLHSSCSPR